MDHKSKLAQCNICTLAQAMKSCATCQFNPAYLKLTESERAIVVHKELLQKGKPS